MSKVSDSPKSSLIADESSQIIMKNPGLKIMAFLEPQTEFHQTKIIELLTGAVGATWHHSRLFNYRILEVIRILKSWNHEIFLELQTEIPKKKIIELLTRPVRVK